MLGILLLVLFEIAGLILCEGVFARRARPVRVWMGLTAGLVMMMWLPSLWAFLLGFSKDANWFALGTAYVLAGLGLLWGWRSRAKKTKDALPPLKTVLALVAPFALLFGFLQYTHYFREVDGALHVGQSTYGDICMHSAIITSLQNASFPPEYSILPGSRLGYPFLMDALSASMVLFGTPLSLSMAVPGALMGVLVFWGFLMLSYKMTGSAKASAVAFLLLFLNGGLGFLYTFDFVAEDTSAVIDMFTGFYRTPTNMPDLNLRWVNILCDMLLPQRTFLAGIAVLIPALWLLCDAMGRRGEKRVWVKLGVLAGTLPMIHTHSFLALGLITLGAMAVLFVRESAMRRVVRVEKGNSSLEVNRRVFNWRGMTGFVVYGLIAVAMALPQLIVWTFPQTGSAGALTIWPGWVNNTGYGLRDETLWFWVKNIGPVFLLLVPAAMHARPREQALAVGAALAFIVANFVRFQMLLYDNNKIMYAAYIVACPLLGSYLVRVYRRLQGIPGRRWLAACFLFISIFSGALSIGREVVSDYQIFSKNETAAAQFLAEETEQHCTVLTGRQHNNLASVLAGKNVVCGPDNFLSTHGLEYSRRAADVVRMYEQPDTCAHLFAQYGVDYVLVSSQERSQFYLDEGWFSERFTLAYENSSVRIYAVQP